MLTIFLAFSFRPEDRELVQRVEGLLESHGARVETGEALGGKSLTPAVKKRIEESDALVALLTRSEKLVAGGWSTHDWVRDELNHARTKRKPAIALVDVAVETGGAYQEHERIDYDRRKESLAFLKLSQTLAEWKRQFGGLVKVRILPAELAQKLLGLEGSAKCEARIVSQGKVTKWYAASLVSEPGALYAYVRGPVEDALIQLRIKIPGAVWQSPAVPQWMDATLSKV